MPQGSTGFEVLGSLPITLTAAELRERARATLEESQRRLDALVADPEAKTVDGFLAALDRLLLGVRNVSSFGSAMFYVHPDAATRAAGREVSEAAERFFNAFRINDAVYREVQRVDLSHADPETRFAVEKLLREMRRSGVELAPDARAKLLTLANEIDQVSNQFAQNINTMERAIELTGPAELPGLPPDYLAAHPPGPDGHIRITTRYTDSHPVMTYCDHADVRRRLLYETMNRAFPENIAVLDGLLARRFAFARSLDYPTYAAFALEDKMLESPGEAREFIERIARLLRSPSERELARLLERKRKDEPGATTVEYWDGSFSGEGYYESKIRREEFGVDKRLLRAYLPYGAVRDGLFRLCTDLFGLTFRRDPNADVWHPSVEAYDVQRDGRAFGRFYLDLVPREGKYNHAAHLHLREGLQGLQLPTSTLVCNFIDPSTPAETARMEYSDVVTFFHEFGHLLHALFSGHGRWFYNTRSYSEWDFVEAPSQLFEEWARDPATVARFARNPDTDEAVPAQLLQRLEAADALGRSTRWLRQVALAAVSLDLYDRDPTGLDTSALFRSTFNRYYPLTIPTEYHPHTSWGHLGGYSAFYYTYAWSLVIARDLLRPFHEKGTITDPEMARRYASEILAPGSTRPAADLVRRYLGRDFSFAAFETWVRAGVPAS